MKKLVLAAFVATAALSLPALADNIHTPKKGSLVLQPSHGHNVLVKHNDRFFVPKDAKNSPHHSGTKHD